MSIMKEAEPMNDECSAISCTQLGCLVDNEIELG